MLSDLDKYVQTSGNVRVRYNVSLTHEPVPLTLTTTSSPTPTVTPSPTPTSVLAECLKWEGTPSAQVDSNATVQIPLLPGWNLISLPGIPSDTAIDTILSGATGVTQVMTTSYQGHNSMACDPASIRTYDALNSISGDRAYWILSSNDYPLNINISGYSGGSQQLPPAFSLAAGWNMIPVVSIGGGVVGSNISVDEYLTGLSWTKVYSFNTAQDSWWSILPNTDQFLEVGKGYYLVLNSAGTLVP